MDFPSSPGSTEVELEPTPDKTFADYTYAKERITDLMQSWTAEIQETDRRRRMRDIRVNVESMRKSGRLKSDETFIPIRMIDTNIRREEPQFVAFVKQSRRVAIFKNVNNPSVSTEKLESEFTRVMQYPDWELPLFKVRDGAATHGWASIETVFDESFPGGCYDEYVEHDKLLFHLDAVNFQSCEFVVRLYDTSIVELRALVKSRGFNKEQVEKVIGVTDKSSDSTRQIAKVFYKFDNIVWVCWFHKDCDDFLLAPTQLFLGRRKQQETQQQVLQTDSLGISPQILPPPVWEPLAETSYPYELLYYTETEKPKISDHFGRCYLDEYKQEAASSLWSSLVNGSSRACNIYGSPKNATDTGGAAPKQTSISLESGKLYDQPIDFWFTPYPDPALIKTVEALETQNSVETNQISYAVNNRQDSRKTATEIQSANQQSSLQSGVQVTMWSIFLRRVNNNKWKIVQSQALQGKIKFLVVIETGQNDLVVISQDYMVFAAGDVDVVQRQEKLQQMRVDWPVVSMTPIAMMFLANYLRASYPDDGEKYAQMLIQGDPKILLIQKLGSVLNAAVTNEQTGQLEPQFADLKDVLTQLAQETMAVLNPQTQSQPQGEQPV